MAISQAHYVYKIKLNELVSQKKKKLKWTSHNSQFNKFLIVDLTHLFTSLRLVVLMLCYDDIKTFCFIFFRRTNIRT